MRKLASREELIRAGYPYGKVTDYIPFGNPDDEWMRTEPDVCLYIPEKDLGPDCDNCVLAVTATPDLPWTVASSNGWLVVLQSTAAGDGNGNVFYTASLTPRFSTAPESSSSRPPTQQWHP